MWRVRASVCMCMRTSGIRNVSMTFFFGISSSNRLADDERAVGEFQKRSPQYCDAYVSYAKLLVCCADSLFGLDVRSRCVVLSSLQVPPHFFTQKSALSTSGIHSTDTGVYYAHIRDAGGDATSSM